MNPLRIIRSRWRNLAHGRGAAILLYHRVSDLSSDPQWLAVSPKLFSRQMEVVRQSFHPLSLSQLRAKQARNSVPARAVVVTFDDGYADNFLNAKPILDQCAIPATIFVVSGHVGSAKEFWWDELEGLLLQNNPKLDSEARWNVAAAGDPTPLHAAYRQWSIKLHGMLPSEREAALDELAAKRGLRRCQRAENRVMTPDEIRQISQNGLIEIGAHTVTHTSLARQSFSEQRAELLRGKEILGGILGKPIQSFAYPFGSRADYNAETLAAVRQAGFDCACANFPGLCRSDSNPLELPRFLVRDWAPGQFESELNRFFNR